MQNYDECYDLFVKNFCFWDHLTDDEKEYLCSKTMIKKFNKGANLHGFDDDSCLGVVLVKSGSLRVYMLSDDGRDITLYRIYSGDTCVLSASCVIQAITFDVFIDAEEDSEILTFSSSVLKFLMEKNIHVDAFVHKIATTRFSDVMWAMQQILFMGVDKRLSIFLVDESAKSGSDEIKLTHEQIAKYMGSAREVVSRMLKYFANEKIVELSRGGIKILDKQKLKKLIQ